MGLPPEMPTLQEMASALAKFDAAVDAEDVLAGTVHAAVCTAILQRAHDALAACSAAGSAPVAVTAINGSVDSTARLTLDELIAQLRGLLDNFQRVEALVERALRLGAPPVDEDVIARLREMSAALTLDELDELIAHLRELIDEHPVNLVNWQSTYDKLSRQRARRRAEVGA